LIEVKAMKHLIDLFKKLSFHSHHSGEELTSVWALFKGFQIFGRLPPTPGSMCGFHLFKKKLHFM